jgi:hypothetical protein
MFGEEIALAQGLLALGNHVEAHGLTEPRMVRAIAANTTRKSIWFRNRPAQKRFLCF